MRLQRTRRHAAFARHVGLTGLVALMLSMSAPAPAAPNRVEIGPRLVTSGQPDAAELDGLAANGFGAVIYLAPPTVPDAVHDEALRVGRQGLVFVNLPIRFDAPTGEDRRAFSAILSAVSASVAPGKVLVHCQINLRASTMTFLHRVVEEHADPRAAWAAVSRVWTPDGPWRALVDDELRRAKIAFDPF